MMDPRLSVIIPALDAAASLPKTLASLEEGRRAGLVDEVVLVDGGSADDTCDVAARSGARVVRAPRGRGAQLAAGAAAASSEWHLFIHADTWLAEGWSAPVRAFIADPVSRGKAGYLGYRLDDPVPAARRLESLVAWRAGRLNLPYGDQGLLIHRDLYRTVGGFRPLPLMEDVDLVRRLGGSRLVAIAATAVTSAERYRSGGYLRRSLRNLACLALYFMGLPPRHILRLYG